MTPISHSGPPAFKQTPERAPGFPVRKASLQDASVLQALIGRSVRELQKNDHSPAQLELALKTAFVLDTQLILDGTYFVVEAGEGTPVVVACGGWSARRTLCGGGERDNSFLDPATDAAKIRQFFVHPEWARRGLGSLLLAHCEAAAQAAGFSRFEMGATLTGVPLYTARGYHIVEHASVPLCETSTLPVVIMARSISGF